LCPGFIADKHECTGSIARFDIDDVVGGTRIVFTLEGLTPDDETLTGVRAWQPSAPISALTAGAFSGGFEQFQILQQAGVCRIPAELGASADARRWLVGRKHDTERAEALGRHRLNREAEPPTDDGGDVAYGIAFVCHGVPCRAGGGLLER
jgi:hypothetical protein